MCVCLLSLYVCYIFPGFYFSPIIKLVCNTLGNIVDYGDESLLRYTLPQALFGATHVSVPLNKDQPTLGPPLSHFVQPRAPFCLPTNISE